MYALNTARQRPSIFQDFRSDVSETHMQPHLSPDRSTTCFDISFLVAALTLNPDRKVMQRLIASNRTHLDQQLFFGFSRFAFFLELRIEILPGARWHHPGWKRSWASFFHFCRRVTIIHTPLANTSRADEAWEGPNKMADEHKRS